MNKQIVITIKLPDGLEETDEVDEINDFITRLLTVLAKNKGHVFFSTNGGRKTKSLEIGNIVLPKWEFYNDHN